MGLHQSRRIVLMGEGSSLMGNHQSRSRSLAGIGSSSSLQQDHPVLLISIVIVDGIRTCQISFSMICTGHWLPPYALRMLCGKWNARVEQKAYLWLEVSYASSSIFNNSLSSFNSSHPHIYPSHHTHLTTLSLSKRQGRLPLLIVLQACCIGYVC